MGKEVPVARPAFDLLIRGGTVVDGSGAPPLRGDVGVVDGRIAILDARGALPETAEARDVIDATGRIVCPGFIDVHVHSELAILARTADRSAGLLQGVTTNFTGPDGFGFAPLSPARAREVAESLVSIQGRFELPDEWLTPAAYLAAFEGISPVNIVAQVPHVAVRVAAMGWEARRATEVELARMRSITRQWMEAGAVGLCVGLDYQPSAHSNTDELVDLARSVAEFGGVYSAHGRYIQTGRAGAFRETMEVGRRAQVPACVSHEMVDAEMSDLLDEAAEAGADLTTESHLYHAGSTHLLYNVPFEDQTGGPAALLARLEDPRYGSDLARRLDAAFAGPAAIGLEAYFSASRTGQHIGRRIKDVAADWGLSPGAASVRLLREELPDAMMVCPWGPTEEEFEVTATASIRHPKVIISSDGVYRGPLPHPRGFGAFPRAIRRFVRELGVVSLEHAIWKMSGLPAERYGLRDRGRTAPGFAADLVVFDPLTIADRATFAEPRLAPVGIDAVIVNGAIAARFGQATGAEAGKVLRPRLG